MMRFGFLWVAWAAAAAISLVCGTTVQAALIIEPVFNRVDGSGQGDNNFPIYDPTFLIDGIAYFNADEPGEIISYASGDPRDPFLDVFHVWNNTQYRITGLTLRLIGTATDTENPGSIVRGPVDAVWGDVNGDTYTGLSDNFATILVSPDGKEIRFEDGVIPVGGRFTDIHLAMSDHPPDFAGIDSSFTGILVPEPAALALLGFGAIGLFGRRHLAWTRRRQRRRLALERLEDRSMMANFNSVDTADLIDDINAANQTPEPDTIALVAGMTYTLTDPDNSMNGWNGLPFIAAGEDLTIVGNGATIERSTAEDALVFRLIHVAAGASLSLENVTLQHGRTIGMNAFAQGGAIFNLGTLTLRNVDVRNNGAEGRGGASAFGGGIYSNGSLTIEGGAFEDNEALGSVGRDSMPIHGGGVTAATRGGRGLGGGLYVAGGAADLDDASFVGNTARGGRGGNGNPGDGDGGLGAGGGLYVASGNVELTAVTLSANSVRGGNGGSGNGGVGGNGSGGGLYAAGGTVSVYDSSATENNAQGGNGGLIGPPPPHPGTPGEGTGGGLCIDVNSIVGLNAFTAAHITTNTASTSDPNIAGAYQIISNPNPLPGDYNASGKVDSADYTAWRNTLGNSVTAYSGADGSGNGVVDQADYDVWKAHFGQTLPPPAAGGASSNVVQSPASPVDSAATPTTAPRLTDAVFTLLGQRTRTPAGPAAGIVIPVTRTAAVDRAITDSLLVVRLHRNVPSPAEGSARRAEHAANDADTKSERTLELEVRRRIVAPSVGRPRSRLSH